ncbi:MAG: GNAT family N-acetyltransferase [Aeromicrobium sp.]
MTELDATRTEDVVLADGRSAVLRRLAPQDRDHLETLFKETSAENLYTRFFGLGSHTVSKHLDHLFSEDRTVISYVVVAGDRALGVADVELLDGVSAEIAFLVADDTHGCGVASLLLERAAADARSSGIEWFVADVLAVNHLMLQVFADIGLTVTTRRDGYDVSLRISTELSPAARAAAAQRAASAREHRAALG